MQRISILLMTCVVFLLGSGWPKLKPSEPQARRFYLGFDRNDYPGDETLASLRRTFSYTGYWLNVPPGEQRNTWRGKRAALLEHGFGFLVLFNGRTYGEIRSAGNAKALGTREGAAAANAAREEGFARGTIIFLDQEQGGRLLPEQSDYLFAWMDAVAAAGYGMGVYCSGIASVEGPGTVVVTAKDIRDHAGKREITYWVTNDACPPSPGCAFPAQAPSPAAGGIDFAGIWQYAQSPRRKDVARGCPANYARDGNCYPPDAEPKRELQVDANTAATGDPSGGRR
jgi:hypothetical protein